MEDNITVTDGTTTKKLGDKRGWVLDALVKVGQLEAAMNHNDEQISFLKERLESLDNPDEVVQIADEIARNEDLIKTDYQNRVAIMDELFNTFNGDRHYYCQLKHRATAYVIACENFHSRDCTPAEEESMHRASQALAMTCSLAFGFAPFSCLRCLDEQLKQKEAVNLM